MPIYFNCKKCGKKFPIFYEFAAIQQQPCPSCHTEYNVREVMKNEAKNDKSG